MVRHDSRRFRNGARRVHGRNRHMAMIGTATALIALCGGSAYISAGLLQAHAEHGQFTEVTNTEFPTEYGIVFKRIMQNSTSASYSPGDYAYISTSPSLADDSFIGLHIQKESYEYILRIDTVSPTGVLGFNVGAQNIGTGVDNYHFNQCGGDITPPSGGNDFWVYACRHGGVPYAEFYLYGSEQHTFSSDDVVIELAAGKSWRSDSLTKSDIAKIEISLDDGTTYPVPSDCFTLKQVGDDWVVCIDSDVNVHTSYNGTPVTTSNVHAVFASYNVTGAVSGGTFTGHGDMENGLEWVDKKNEYTATITADSTHYLPDALDSITVAGKQLETSQYTYDSSTGNITINAEAVIGDIDIKATCPARATLATTVAPDANGTNVSETVHYTTEVTGTTETEATAEDVTVDIDSPDLIADGGIMSNFIITAPDGTDITEQCTVTDTSTGVSISTPADIAYGDKLSVSFDVTYGETTTRPLLENTYSMTATADAADTGKYLSTSENEATESGVYVYKPVLTIDDVHANMTTGAVSDTSTDTSNDTDDVTDDTDAADDSTGEVSDNVADASSIYGKDADITLDDNGDDIVDGEQPSDDASDTQSGADADVESTDETITADSGDRIRHTSTITQTDANGKAFNPSVELQLDAEAAANGAYIDPSSVEVKVNGDVVDADVTTSNETAEAPTDDATDDAADASGDQTDDSTQDDTGVETLAEGDATQDAIDGTSDATDAATDGSATDDGSDAAGDDAAADVSDAPSTVNADIDETLASGDQMVVTYDVVLADDYALDIRDTTVETTASVTADNADEVSDSNAVDVLKPVLSIAKTADVEDVEENGAYTSTLNIAQTTAGAHAKHIAVRDALSGEVADTGKIDADSLRFELNGEDVTDTFTVTQDADNSFDATSDNVLDDDDQLVVTYTVNATAENADTLVANDISNTAYVSGSNAEETNAAVDVNVYRIVHIAYEASPADSGCTVSLEGEDLDSLTGEAKGATAEEKNGWLFEGWYDENGDLVTEDYTISPEMPENGWVNATYTAKFTKPIIQTGAEHPAAVATITGGSIAAAIVLAAKKLGFRFKRHDE